MGGSDAGGSPAAGSSGTASGTAAGTGGVSGHTSGGGAPPTNGGSAGTPDCGGGSGQAALDGEPPPAGSNTVLRWYENGQLLGEQAGNALFIFQTDDVGPYAGRAAAELPMNNVYYQPLRLSFDHASTLTPGLYTCGDGIDVGVPVTPSASAPVSLYVLDSIYASNTPDSWQHSDFIPYPWDLLDAHRACTSAAEDFHAKEGFSSTARVRVDSFGTAVSAEFELLVTSDDAALACKTLRVHGVLKDVPLAECPSSQACNELLGHDLGIRAPE